jgi:hypothetical protein
MSRSPTAPSNNSIYLDPTLVPVQDITNGPLRRIMCRQSFTLSCRVDCRCAADHTRKGLSHLVPKDTSPAMYDYVSKAAMILEVTVHIHSHV